MAGEIGALGTVAWSTGVHAQLSGTGTQPREWTLNTNAEDFDTTVFGNTGARTTLPGLYDWSGTFRAILKAPGHGSGGLVTYASGYAANINSYDLAITRDEFDATVFNATPPTAKSWLPGLFVATGNYSGLFDDTTLVVLPGVNATEPAAATFKYQEKGATDNTLAFSIVTNRLSVSAGPNKLNDVSYSFKSSGDITQSTPSAGVGILPVGALGLQAASTLTLTSDGTRTFSGSAFWTRINMSVRLGQLVELEVGFRGSGALTIS